ncbi:signal peptidase I [Salinibacter ruber]|jgi:signal peptidase I|uniref:Signal peptidase I n=3 Tax=Salinibacter ruber TaxID=146919 RepID=Q2S5H9_SALRD|nr:signal peptidase I [Salinibacter ruber]ABC44194.1 signal peptidase I [Salinibacter ruber DSM 13855]MBB4061064.1 signal peptidase I [Salinibacter ruber]MBB4069996.1 signal peptidase I [Salinibacter ruber]MBB4089730.1 signal peptidase I [Salinibacter ruber]MCS3610230.1 signal peptidase I [Salinibacter ruber]
MSTDDSSRDADARKSELRQWGESLVVAVVIVLIVRSLLFDLFRIPTPSMEENLLVGDYLVVSKLHYGPRTPVSLGIPLTSIHLPGVTFPYHRLPGFSEVQRGDPIVFNYPPDDEPIDRKVHYVKRVIGMPGDTLSVRDKLVHIDGDPLPLGRGMQQYWTVTKSDARYQIPRRRMEEMGISEVRRTNRAETVRVLATPEGAKQMRQRSWVRSIEPYVLNSDEYNDLMYPSGRGYTPDNYGPVHIPAKGTTVKLTDRNWALYRPVIVRYEGHDARQMTDSTFAIDGARTSTYTFQQDYFFAMGDNRDNSQDSRFWGFVPMDHVVGKAVLTYFSWDHEAWLPRFGRILRPIADAGVFREQPVMNELSGGQTAGVPLPDSSSRARPPVVTDRFPAR